MKEYKTRKNNKKDELVKNDDSDILFGNDDPIDNKINKDLNEIREKLKADNLSDEFKEKLRAKIEEELNKEDTNKGKVIKFPTVTRKLVGICASLILIFTSCFVCADDIENVVLELFGKTDKIIAKAIEEGTYKEIDMDYVEDQGLSIKVDYVVVEDDELYIAFNVLGDEYSKISFLDININANNNFVLYKTKMVTENTKLIADTNYIYNDNMIVVYKLTGKKLELSKIDELNINISEISFVKNNIRENKNGKWNLEVNI